MDNQDQSIITEVDPDEETDEDQIDFNTNHGQSNTDGKILFLSILSFL